jgi:hypothetical protein
MNDYEKTIKDLQDRVKSLEERLTPCNGAVAKPKKWSPVGGEHYVCNGNAIRAPASMNAPREFGVERPTLQQAERAAVEMRRFNRLLALRDELCGDEVVDWEDIDFRKYYLFFNHDNGKWVSTYDDTCYETITHYFTSKESAQKACDMLNSDEVEL